MAVFYSHKSLQDKGLRIAQKRCRSEAVKDNRAQTPWLPICVFGEMVVPGVGQWTGMALPCAWNDSGINCAAPSNFHCCATIQLPLLLARHRSATATLLPPTRGACRPLEPVFTTSNP